MTNSNCKLFLDLEWTKAKEKNLVSVRNKFSLDAAGANDPAEEGRGFQLSTAFIDMKTGLIYQTVVFNGFDHPIKPKYINNL